MAVLITGSLAYDRLMVFDGRFREHILPEQVHILNVCFLTSSLRQEFGGCAGNIAYSLQALGGTPVIMGTLGAVDSAPYLAHLNTLGLPTRHVRAVEQMHTAQAMIMTDLDNNQITAFHPGAMLQSHLNRVDEVEAKLTLGIISPDGIEGMQQHAEQCAAKGIPFVFDPGQQLPLFNEADLQHMLELASYVTLNDYEAKLLSNKTGWSMDQIAQRVNALIVTRGEYGSLIYAEGKCEEIPAVPATQVIDPTGCGDAFRGGLLYGIEHGFDWSTTGRLASLMGSIKIAHQGTQNFPDREEMIREHFKRTFTYSFQ